MLSGPRLDTESYRLRDIALDPQDRLYVVDELRRIVRRVEGDQVTTVAGNRLTFTIPDARQATSVSLRAEHTAVDANGNLYLLAANVLLRIDAVNGLVTHVAGTGADCVSGACGTGGPQGGGDLCDRL